MTILEEAVQLLDKMTQAEKIRLLRKIAVDIDSVGIETTPGICGGAPRVANTRIPVWTLVQYRNLGADDKDLLRTYPSLSAANLADAWSYYQDNKQQIDSQIAENEMS